VTISLSITDFMNTIKSTLEINSDTICRPMLLFWMLSLISGANGLNYFWLSHDPVETARWYCDQHCFKIGSEVVESIWDSVLVLCPELSKMADSKGMSKATRKRRHARDGVLWHPLSVWHGLCRANMRRGLINARAIFEEHLRRTGKRHSAWTDCEFLWEHIDEVDFNSEGWLRWFQSQSGEEGLEVTPPKTKSQDLAKRREWCLVHAAMILEVDRDECEMTEPPQCINEDQPLFKGCRSPGNVVQAYRRYYKAKVYSLGVMRYYHHSPIPEWLRGCGVIYDDKGKTKLIPYRLGEDGYVIVNF
jgi:hypothetical protein